MADIRVVARDPEFQKLPLVEQKKAFAEMDSDFAKLPPVEQERGIRELIARESAPKQEQNILQKAAPWVRGGLEAGGFLLGGFIGAPAGPITAAGGAGLGYAGGKQAANVYDQAVGLKQPDTYTNELLNTGKDVVTGAGMYASGPVTEKIAAKGLQMGGKAVKQLWGRATGTGTGTIEEAIASGEKTGLTKTPFKSATEFDKALRGEITGEEVVANAKNALNVLKENRSTAYQSQLKAIEQNGTKIDLQPIKDKANQLLRRYVRFDEKGNPDWTRSALGQENSEGVRKIKEIMETVTKWGEKEGDATPTGLDMLKRQLDDFYSESSNARSFVSSLRNEVKNKLVKEVPQYEKMTKGYAEATQLIKDIEAGLSLKKQGMTGRVTADMTLRRLMSSMKDNFELRKELVGLLGEQGGQDLGGQIAGHAMRSAVPLGLAGAAPVLIGEWALAKFISPKFWPILAASSPRVAGEFLRLYGKFAGIGAAAGSVAVKGASAATVKGASEVPSMKQESRKWKSAADF